MRLIKLPDEKIRSNSAYNIARMYTDKKKKIIPTANISSEELKLFAQDFKVPERVFCCFKRRVFALKS